MARIRMVKMVSAMRADMPIDGAADGDGDGLPNEWEMWRFGNLSQTGAGDPDGDGIINLFERAYGTSPTARNAPADAPAVTMESGSLALRYLRSIGPMASDLSLGAEWSADLLSPWSIEGIEDTLESTDANGIQHRVARVPLTYFPSGKGFMRLEVEP